MRYQKEINAEIDLALEQLEAAEIEEAIDTLENAICMGKEEDKDEIIATFRDRATHLLADIIGCHPEEQRIIESIISEL